MDASHTRRLAAGTFEASETSEVENIDVRRAGSPTPLLSRRASEGSTGSALFFDAHDDNNPEANNNQKNGTAVSLPKHSSRHDLSSSTAITGAALIDKNIYALLYLLTNVSLFPALKYTLSLFCSLEKTFLASIEKKLERQPETTMATKTTEMAINITARRNPIRNRKLSLIF